MLPAAVAFVVTLSFLICSGHARVGDSEDVGFSLWDAATAIVGAQSFVGIEDATRVRCSTSENGLPECVDPDAYLNVTQIINRWGYPAENHRVITADGYILQIQRIPRGANEGQSWSVNKPRRVAFLQHGLFGCAFDFVNNLPNESLAFFLADSGYDVWLGNVRGTTYSRHHVNKTADDLSFWHFSFDEFITYDLPAMIDYVLNITGQPSLYYVGHSQGSAIMFGLLSSMPKFQKKIAAFAALGPVANVTQITAPIRYLAPFAQDASWLAEWLGVGEIGASSPLVKLLARTLCAFATSREFCVAFVWFGVGVDVRQLNVTRIPVYMSHTPAGTSVRNVVHFGQEVLAGRFRKYDYGVDENLKRYGDRSPPEYDIRKITNTPVGLYWSERDTLADPKDVAIIASRVPSLMRNYKVPEKDFTHLDFAIGITARKLVYEDLLKFFAQH